MESHICLKYTRQEYFALGGIVFAALFTHMAYMDATITYSIIGDAGRSDFNVRVWYMVLSAISAFAGIALPLMWVVMVNKNMRAETKTMFAHGQSDMDAIKSEVADLKSMCKQMLDEIKEIKNSISSSKPNCSNA